MFDKGTMTDGEGREIDFRNTVIIMTSNAGTDLLTKLFADPETAPGAAELKNLLRPELLKHFKPAFLGRMTVVPYLPLPAEIINRIARMQLDRVARRVRDSYGAHFEYDDAVVAQIAARCTESDSGARNVENILSHTLLPEMSARILSRMADSLPLNEVTVVTESTGEFAYELS